MLTFRRESRFVALQWEKSMRNTAVFVGFAFALFASSSFAQMNPGGQTKLSDLGCGPDEVARVDAAGSWGCSSALTTLENQNLDSRISSLENSSGGSPLVLVDSTDQAIGTPLALFSSGNSALVKISITDNF